MYDDEEEDIHIDLTSLIDVIFMLVIFFVMTMTFSRPVLDVVLPESSAAQVQKKGEELVVAVHRDGSVWHEGREVAADALPALLATRPEALLNLHMDEKAPFEAFVKVVDIAKEKRDGRFIISTEKAAR